MVRATKKLWAGATAAAMSLASVVPGWALDGTWQGPSSDNDWDTPTNWVGGAIADGANFTANFTGPDLTTGGNLVTMNLAPHTIGNLVFSDSNSGTGAAGDNWDIQGANALTLSNTTQPTITVNALPTGSAAILSVPVAGTQGFAKAGVGQLALNNATSTITGPISVNQGTLRLDAALNGTANNPGTVPITLGNGTTLIASVGQGPGTNAASIRQFNVASGSTANIRITSNVEMGRIAAGGATLNVTLENAGNTFTAAGDWNIANNTAGSATAFNVSAPNGGFLALAPNLSGQNSGIRNWDATNGFSGTAVSLSNTTMWTRTNSTGNTVNIGSLTGDATSILSGGGQGGGTVARYSIGALGTNTVFAGNIDTTSAPTPNSTDPLSPSGKGGLDLIKVGSGTLTLSGTLSYQPTNNYLTNTVATAPSHRGGITTVSAGTLKLTGPAAIPGGTANAVIDAIGTTANLFSTLRINSGATLDVSTTATPYSTAPLQQVIGAGTIVGNYTHDEGVLAPGDTNSGTTATLVTGAGTLTFANNLSFAGAGEIKFNVTSSTLTGNDLIQVNGVTSLTGTPTLTLGLIGGITTGNYTIINSTGGFGGTNPSGWVVPWAGRGSAPALSVSGNQLILAVTPSNFGSLNWSGVADGTTWDVNGAANWHNNNTNAADKFFDNDSITFGDAYGPGNTPVASGNIALGVTASPLNMTFNSNTVVYTITGAGKISGAASLTKTGSTLLTLQTANDFSGPASVSGSGGVDIGSFSTALGTGALTLTNTKLTTTGGTMSNSGLVIPTGTASEIAANAGATLVLPALSGDGNLLITSDAARQVDFSSNVAGFTGDLTIGAPGSPNNIVARLQGGSLPSTKVTLNNTSLRDRATSAQVQTFGALEGDATSSLWGYQGGSTSTGRTYRIGALNTSTTFAGLIQDSINVGTDPFRVLNIHKIGTGTLTLTGGNFNTSTSTSYYTGRTAVEQGTLSISPTTTGLSNYLADAGDVLLFTGATLELNIAGETDIIDQLFVNGINLAPGIYGGIGSAAAPANQLAQISGTGLLQVTTYRIPGDFDGMNGVNAADLDVWKTATAATSLAGQAAGDTDGDGDADGNDFLIWQRFLGTPATTIAAAAVPEPASALLAAGAMLGLAGAARRRK